MPPAFRNNLGPTACDTPASTAAASLFNPAAIPRQNSSCSARPATGGRPNEPSRARVDRFFRVLIATSVSGVLRRPIESASGLPCAMVLRLIRALSGDHAFLPPSSARRVSVFANLAPASERQDHTTSPSAQPPLVAQELRPAMCVHRIPLPTSVTIASRPSYGCETSESIVLICPTTQCRGCATQWHDGQIMLVRYALGVMPPLVICRRVTAGTAGAPRLCCRLASKPAIWYR